MNAAVERLIDLDHHDFNQVLDPTELVIAEALWEPQLPIPEDLLDDPVRVVRWMNAYHAIRVTAALRDAGLVTT